MNVAFAFCAWSAMLVLGARAMASLDWSQCPAVESVPGKVSGAWVLKGTRMPVSAIFENLEAGANVDDIMKWYGGLDRKQVEAVVEFAARSLASINAPAFHRASGGCALSARLERVALDRSAQALRYPPPHKF
jgi:uncharacterized protein (DUF433 family)